MSSYLLEVGLEEVPARFLPGIFEELSQLTKTALEKNRLSFSCVKTTGSYRRFIVMIDGLGDMQSDLEETITGPPAAIAFKEGVPQPAAIGFAKRFGLDVATLKTQVVDGKDVVVAEKKEKGQPVATVLSEIMPSVVQSLSLPIAMKWGRCEYTFIRPVHWILSLLDDKVVPFELFGVCAGNTSFGHRFLTPSTHSQFTASGSEITIQNVAGYVEQLKSHFVNVDADSRRAQIQSVLKTSGDVRYPESLLEEVVGLVENPKIIKGQFETKFLELPQDVLIECMQKHQKYFPVYENGVLSNTFLVAAENVTDANESIIRKGNESVLRARLEDVRFFWEDDKSRSVEHFQKKLEAIVFQKGLGTIADRVKRVVRLALDITSKLTLDLEVKKIVQRGASLSKFDLATSMVYELPNLQGVMGRIYAAREFGETHVVSEIIEDHYKPVSATGELPRSESAAVVAIADKLDLIVSCYANGHIPSGSQDPLGIRRAMLGIVRILEARGWALNLEAAIDFAYEAFSEQEKPNRENLISFFKQRIEIYWQQNHFDLDLIQFSERYLLTDLVLQKQLISHVMAYRTQYPDRFKKGIEAIVRVSRLAQKAPKEVKTNPNRATVHPDLFEHNVESRLFDALHKRGNLDETTSEGMINKFNSIMSLEPIISTYFDQILVIGDDAKRTDNRLTLLAKFDYAFKLVGDFEKVLLS